jgi:hypothetical protein
MKTKAATIARKAERQAKHDRNLITFDNTAAQRQQRQTAEDQQRCRICGGFFGDYGSCVTVGCEN